MGFLLKSVKKNDYSTFILNKKDSVDIAIVLNSHLKNTVSQILYEFLIPTLCLLNISQNVQEFNLYTMVKQFEEIAEIVFVILNFSFHYAKIAKVSICCNFCCVF